MTAQPKGEDHVTVVGAGVTLLEALKAADLLKAEGINLRVIDPFTIKPLDADLIASSVKHTDGRLITVEDHAPEGEVQSIVLATKSRYGVRSLTSYLWSPRRSVRGGGISTGREGCELQTACVGHPRGATFGQAR